MPTDRVNDLPAFKAFLNEKLPKNGTNLTVDEALALWELENQTEQEREETLEAIRQGLADVEAGRTRPFEAFDHEFRAKYGLVPRA